MININKPLDKIEDILTACTRNMHNNEKNNYLKDRILGSKQHIIAYTDDLEEKIESKKVYKLTEHDRVGNNVIKKEMIKLYDQNMVGGNGRDYYNKLMAAAPRGICPLCNKRECNTLDHYLPKSKFPTLSISPINLVPACSECNKIKTAEVAGSEENQAMHPYFDVIDNEEWLFAEICEDERILVKYYINKPRVWDNTLYQRVCNHMNNLDLYTLYSKAAAIEMEDNKIFFKILLKDHDVDMLKKILETKKLSLQAHSKNSWKIALYREMCSSSWFIDTWIGE